MNSKITPHAHRLVDALRNEGIIVDSELGDGYKHVDVILPEAQIVVEVDGSDHLTNPHQVISDLNREYYDERKGYGTIHIQNIVLDRYFSEIVKSLVEVVKLRKLIFEKKKTEVIINKLSQLEN